jgi:Spy/CpxP family protein refolding chaperone
MSNKLSLLLIAITLLSFTTISLAFNPPCGGPGQAGNLGPGGGRMAQQLNLTTEQQQQFQNIMQEQRKIGQAWREKHHQEVETQLSKVLDEEQLKNFKAFKQARPKKTGMGFNRANGYGRAMRY